MQGSQAEEYTDKNFECPPDSKWAALCEGEGSKCSIEQMVDQCTQQHEDRGYTGLVAWLPRPRSSDHGGKGTVGRERGYMMKHVRVCV